VKDPEVAARFDSFAFEPLAWSPQEIVQQAEAKSRTYEALIKRANISLE
jgi:tripartite-type tricarboxylate transporter receptor subunit TctC